MAGREAPRPEPPPQRSPGGSFTRAMARGASSRLGDLARSAQGAAGWSRRAAEYAAAHPTISAVGRGAAYGGLQPVEGASSERDYWRRVGTQAGVGGLEGFLMGSPTARYGLAGIPARLAGTAAGAGLGYEYGGTEGALAGGGLGFLRGGPLYRTERRFHHALERPLAATLGNPALQRGTAAATGYMMGRPGAPPPRPNTGPMRNPDDY